MPKQRRPSQPKDLKALQKIWYEKLKKSGFKDAERPDGRFHLCASSLPSRYNSTFFAAREEYFRLAGQLLHEYPFESTSQMLVWRLHSEGLSIREIVKELRKYKVYMKRFVVHKTVKTIAITILDRARAGKTHE